MADGPRRFLVVLPGSEHVESCEPWLRALLDRDHRVDLALISAEKSRRGLEQRLADEYPGLVLKRTPKPEGRGVVNLRRGLLALADVARHQHPEGPATHDRAAARLPAARHRDGPLPTDVARAYRRTLGRISHPAYARRASSLLLRMGLVPEPDVRLVEWIVRQGAEVVAFSSLVTVGSLEVEFALAARAAGVPTALVVGGARALSDEGLIKGEPDLVVVCSELQRLEAMADHGLPRSRIAVVGSAAFDPCYAALPPRSAGEVSGVAGPSPERSFVLFRSSAAAPAAREIALARELAARLGAPGVGLELLVYPDVRDRTRWDLEPTPGAAALPKGSLTVTTETLVDATCHSAAVVSLDVTALLEAAVLGRPAFAVVPDLGGESDERRALLDDFRGTVRIVASAGELLTGLQAGDPDPCAPGTPSGVDILVRPLGRDIPVAPLIADALEQLSKARLERPASGPVGPRVARGYALAAAMSASGNQSWTSFLAARVRSLVSHEPDGTRAAVRAKKNDKAKKKNQESASVRPGGRATQLVIFGPWRGDATAELLYWLPWLRAACAELGATQTALVLHVGREPRWYRSLDAELLDVRELRSVGQRDQNVAAAVAERYPDAVTRFADTERVEQSVMAYRRGRRGVSSVMRWGSLRRLVPADGSGGGVVAAIAGGDGDPARATAGVAARVADAATALIPGAHPAVDLVDCDGWDDLTDLLLRSTVACVTDVESAALAVCTGVDTIMVSDGLTDAGEADFDVIDRLAATLGVELTRIAASGVRLVAGTREGPVSETSL